MNTSVAEAQYEELFGVPWLNCTGAALHDFPTALLPIFSWILGAVEVIADGATYMPWMAVQAK